MFANLGESEGSDLSSIDLGTTQDNLITAVAAANPNTVVVLNTGSAVTMPWLSSVKGVLEAWYPGQEDGTAIANVLFGNYDPSGHLTVTFPTSLSQVPASTTAQWPGTGGTVQYSEGIDVGYRWYDSQDLTPLFPFGYGLSYTTFSFSNLQVGSLTAGGVGDRDRDRDQHRLPLRRGRRPAVRRPTRPPPASPRCSWRASSGSTWPPGRQPRSRSA